MIRQQIRFMAICVLAMLLALATVGPAHAQAHETLPDVIAKLRQSVVPVGTFANLRSPPFVLRGSAFAVEDGRYLITNAHVIPTLDVESGESLSILVGHGIESRRDAVTVVTVDSDHDIAVLRTSGPALPALKFGDSALVREGQSIAFMGFPIGGALGLSPVTHRGIVSAVTPIAIPAGNANQLAVQAIQRLRAGPFNIFQLDATAYPGNSGGPLFDPATGDVLGILNMVFVKESKESVLQKPSGISYAIPARYVQDILAELKRTKAP